MPIKKATRLFKTLSQKYHDYNGSYLHFIKSHLVTKILPPSLIVLALFLIFLPFSVHAIIHNNTHVWRTWGADQPIEIINVYGETTAVQPLTPDMLANNFDTISVLFGTYQRTNLSTYHFTMYHDEDVLVSYDFSAADVIDNTSRDFFIPPFTLDTDGNYYFTISSSDATPDNSLAVVRQGENLVFTISMPSPCQPFVIVISIIILIFFFAVNFLINHGKITTERHFLLYMLFFLLPLVLIYPPYEVPDEPYHFKSTLRLTQYDITKSPSENLSREPIVPVTMDCLNYSSAEVLENIIDPTTIGSCFTSSAATEPETFIIGGGSSNSTLLAYLPAALGVKIADLLTDSPMIIFYAGRLTNFLAVYAILIFAVHNAKKHRLLLLATIFIPMFLQQSISYSYDAILNALCLVVISYAIRFLSTTTKVRKRDIVILAITTGFIAVIKLPYLLLCTPFLFIPHERFGSSRIAKFRAAGIILLSTAVLYLLCVNIFQPVASDSYSPSNSVASLLDIKHDLKVAFHTLKTNLGFYLQSFIGNFGWLSHNLSQPLTLLYYAFLLLLPFTQKESHLMRITRIVSILAIFICAASFFLAMYLVWTSPGEVIIAGVQGRYFLTLLPLLLFVLLPAKKSFIKLPINTAYSFLAAFTLFYVITIAVAFY